MRSLVSQPPTLEELFLRLYEPATEDSEAIRPWRKRPTKALNRARIGNTPSACLPKRSIPIQIGAI